MAGNHWTVEANPPVVGFGAGNSSHADGAALPTQDANRGGASGRLRHEPRNRIPLDCRLQGREGSRMTRAERQRKLETFHKGCREALALLYGPLPTESERREAARALGEEHRLPEPQDELPLGAA